MPEYGVQGKSQDHLLNRLGKDNHLCDGHETRKTCQTEYKLDVWIVRWTKIYFIGMSQSPENYMSFPWVPFIYTVLSALWK